MSRLTRLLSSNSLSRRTDDLCFLDSFAISCRTAEVEFDSRSARNSSRSPAFLLSLIFAFFDGNLDTSYLSEHSVMSFQLLVLRVTIESTRQT